ncbi:hypothetical protein [Haloferula sp. A504]|uniref:hypothetical protein n=1 Tax=Haloferula sp. A504 TaxID=3373601 RepID=UPI0031CAA6BD|nr:hypothetical protein [Verrucomicrobiaceae bacterium E54]
MWKVVAPVLLLNDRHVTYCSSVENLTQTFKGLMGVNLGANMLDSNGNFWKIRGISSYERLDPWWLRWARGASAPVRVCYEFEDLGPCSIESACEELKRALKKRGATCAILQGATVEELDGKQASSVLGSLEEIKDFNELASRFGGLSEI